MSNKSTLVDAWREYVATAARDFDSKRPPRPVVAAQLLKFLRNDTELRQHFDHLSSHDADALERELAGEIVGDVSHAVSAVRGLTGLVAHRHDKVLEDGGKGMRYYKDRRFENWGKTVSNRPELTFIPRTKQGVCNLVRWAREHNKTVRVAGYRHTWGDLYSEDNQVLVSLLPVRFVEDLPSIEPKLDPKNELQGIAIVGTIQENGVEKALCRIGAATTNEMFREWCLGNGKEDWLWTVPFNVIMVEITYGGSNGPICHGAGRHSTTLSDLVASIEFVNAKGELQTVDDPAQLKVAAGCFGLLGVVTSITLKLDPMTYAKMQPTAPRLALAVPPPPGFVVPADVDMSGITPAELAVARDRFVAACEDDYYAEWFWFAFQDRCWVNTWKNDGKKADAKDYPGPIKTEWQKLMEYLAEVANTTVFKLLPPRCQATLMTTLAMQALPVDTTIVTPLIDALHFQRGIQNMRVLDMEFEIPIPARADAPTLPDWTVCQRAWWDVIRIVYGRGDTPMRLTMEMRITGGSEITLAPQCDNKFGTCSIEVLTTLNVDDKEWADFMQEVVDAWAAYKDAAGQPLNLRPHWAKQWEGLTVRDKPIVRFLVEDAYAAKIPNLKLVLQQVSSAGGYTVSDLRDRFTNPLLRQLFGGALV